MTFRADFQFGSLHTTVSHLSISISKQELLLLHWTTDHYQISKKTQSFLRFFEDEWFPKFCPVIGISYGSVQASLLMTLTTEKYRQDEFLDLQMSKNNNTFQVCQRLLIPYQAEGDTIPQRIVTCNETRMHYYAPIIKQVTVKWRKNGKVPSLKAKMWLSAEKVLLIIFLVFQK